jgi:glycosyltransferase involved in cell wall biosynthesis
LRILQVTKYFHPAISFGGPVQCSYNLSKNLVKMGHEVSVYTTNALSVNPNRMIRDRFRIMNGAEVSYFPNIVQTYDLFFSPGIIEAMKKNLDHFDLVHLHEFRTFQNVVFHYSRRAGTPYVLSFHAQLTFKGEQMRRELSRRLFDQTFGKNLIKDASKLHALTKFEASQFVQNGIDKERIAVIPNGVAPEEFADPPPPGRFRELFEIEEEKLILYIGRIHARKGLDFLVRAFSILAKYRADVRLVIAGPDFGYLNALEEIVAGLDLNGKILFTGTLNRTEVLAAYNDAAVVVYSTLQEGSPIVPLEAAVMARPLVVSDDPSMDFVRKENCGLVVKYGDVAQLAEALDTILEDSELARKLGQNGKNAVLNNFTWSKIAEKIESTYLEIVN